MKPSVKADQARCEVPRNTSPGFFLRVCAMNWQTGLGLIARHVLTTIGGGLVASGVIDSGQLETGIGAIMVLSGIVWSVWQKRGAK
jgi:hypothetical protein